MLQISNIATLYSIDREVFSKNEKIISPQVLDFITSLHRQFNKSRVGFINTRNKNRLNNSIPDLNPKTSDIRLSFWNPSVVPEELQDRRSELYGPVDRYSLIDGLNSKAKIYIAHFEECHSFEKLLEGQLNLKEALNRCIEFISEDELQYTLNEQASVLKVCPRGIEVSEENLKVEGDKVCAALFDFALFLYNNVYTLISKGSNAYFYLKGVENAEEAKWWNEVFEFAEREMDIPSGSIKATVVINSIDAAFQMEEIIYELRERIDGLAAGSCSSLLNFVKNYNQHPICREDEFNEKPLAETFIQTFHQTLIRVCHKRNIHAISAVDISEKPTDPVDRQAFQEILRQKEREAMTGFDGTIVTHPRLVDIAHFAFDKHLKGAKNQKNYHLNEYRGSSKDLIKPSVVDEFENTFKVKDYHRQKVKRSLTN
jgi:malate synthase